MMPDCFGPTTFWRFRVLPPVRALFVAAALLAGACSGDGAAPVAPGPDAARDVSGADGLHVGDADSPGDAADAAGGTGDAAGSCEGAPPPGHATIRFAVDDRARRTFQDGELVWTGSFALDRDTNVITFATSWLPTDGPFPLLYDDGPRATCGHEPPDAVAGDHVFATEVWFAADPQEDTTFEYGLLNEFGTWMWVGPNGRVVVPAGSSDVVPADGMVIPPCGEADLELTIDLRALDAGFVNPDDPITPWSGDTPPNRDVYVKGTMNMWTDVLLVDNGKRGDAVEKDGIYTFVLSENVGKHDCLLLAGEHAQFVFTFALPEQPPATGSEYKDLDGAAIAGGVAARLDPTGGGAWQDAPVTLELASDGRRQNTTVVVPGAAPVCDTDAECGGDKAHCIVGWCVPCFEDAHCGAGEVCRKNHCEEGGAPPDCTADGDCADGVCVEGFCVECRDAATCPEGWSCTANVCVEPAQPDCTADGDCPDGVCEGGFCVECREAGDCEPDETCRGNRCVLGGGGDGPLLYQLTPAAGPSTGGTAVTLKGAAFQEGMVVGFGATLATDIVVESGQLATCTTPPNPGGRVDVTVQNPDGGADTFYGGYFYYGAGEGPQITSVQPDRGPTTGGSAVAIRGANFADGVQVKFGGAVAAVVRRDATLLHATAPPGAAGAVTVTVTNPDGLIATCDACYTYVQLELHGTPTIDGTIGADWPANHLVAENTDVPSNWGDGNLLQRLYVAYDATHLYVGVVGVVGADNALVAYLDVDGDDATGIAGANGCQDDGAWGDLDDALCVTQPEQEAGDGSGSLWFGSAAFGADFAFGSRGMASYDDADCDPLGAAAGWRQVGGLTNPADLAWLCGQVVANAADGFVEASVPLSVLYPDGLPAGGADVGLVVRIVSAEGNYLSNQSLPPIVDGGNVYEVTGTVRFRMD